MRKIRLISKFIMSQSGKLIITINILHNISRSKGNQTIKYSQFIEHNMLGKLVPDSFKGRSLKVRKFSLSNYSLTCLAYFYNFQYASMC